MFYVIEDRVYSDVFDTVNNRYPLVSISKAADGSITVTDEGDGIDKLPALYRRCTLDEVIAIFGISSTTGYKPRATITGNDPVTIYLDEEHRDVTLTVSNPSTGAFSDVASSDSNVATVTESSKVFTIVPVGVGECVITATWTPTDTDFATSVVKIPVTVVKRQIEFAPVRDQNLTINTPKTIVLQPNVSSGSTLSYTVLSSDTDICTVAITGTEGHENDLVITPAKTTPLGTAIISVSAVDTQSKALDSEIMWFKVRVCASAVSITAIDNIDLKAGESKEISVKCAGATIREVTTSDSSHVAAEITGKLKLKVTAVGDPTDTATITVYCDKRGYGEDSEDFTVTIT